MVNCNEKCEDLIEKIKFIQEYDGELEINLSEPTTNWIEELDSRTDYPFYWNSETKESVWDIPNDYSAYIKELKLYMEELVVAYSNKFEEIKKKDTDHFKTLIGYSDSDNDDEDKNEDTPQNEGTEISNINDNSGIDKTSDDEKEKWFNEQKNEADLYLNELIKRKSDEIEIKINILEKFKLSTDELRFMLASIKVRVEDWSDGYLQRERLVEKLSEALQQLAYTEASMETDQWEFSWDETSKQYNCTHRNSKETTTNLLVLKHNMEEGEVLESNDDDIAQDLKDYVTTTLHTSFGETFDDVKDSV